MGYLADIYVIKKTRSKRVGKGFLDHFLPFREETTNEYLIPQFSDNPIQEFNNADDLMVYLEAKHEYDQGIYWVNKDDKSLNKYGMIFYTRDGNMIFGISRNADMSGNLNTDNKDKCLREMKHYFKTQLGYIHYENPPAETYDQFVEIVNQIEKISKN